MPILTPANFDTVFTAVSELLDREHLDLHPDDRAMLQEAHTVLATAKGYVASPALRELAQDQYGTDDVEIDDEPATSPADNGTWVSAWVWIAQDDADLEEAAEGQTCTACERSSIDCSRDPCPDVIADREA